MRVIYPQQVPLLAAAIVASLLAVLLVASSASSQTASPTSTPTPTATASPASPTPTESPTPLPSPSPVSIVSASELQIQRQKWSSLAINSYLYVLRLSCFCGPPIAQPFTVTVRDGVTDSLVDEQGLEVALDDAAFGLVLKFATIEKLFTEVERLTTASYYSASVTYDATYGFPSQISYDAAAWVADDTLLITVSGLDNVQPISLPRTGGPP